MLMENGRQKLQEFDKQAFPEAFDQVAPGIWHVTGLGHSNAIVVEGRASVLLIDTLDTYERGERLLAWIRKEIGKPVKTIIYTGEGRAP